MTNIRYDQAHLGNIDVSSYGGVDSSRNLIRHLATNVAFNQAVPQQQMVSSMQQLQLSHQQILLPQLQPHLPLQARLAQQQSPAHLAVHLLHNPDFQQQQPLHLRQPLISSQLINQQQLAFQAHQVQPNLGTQQQQVQLQCQLQQQQFQQQQQHLGIVNKQPQRSLPPSFGVSFLATQPQLVNRHFALLDQELQLQKELTRVTIGIIKGSPDDVQMLEAELTIQKALDCVQKERAGLEVETRELEMAAARRQAEMVERALMLERELLEMVKQREMAHLARKRENEKERQAQNSGPATISNGIAPRDGGFDGMEAKREGTREEDSIQGMGIVFGEVKKDLVMRKCSRKHILSTTTADQSQDKVGGEDGRSEATSTPVIVDLTNNSTFEVYNSDEDNSQGELYVSHEPVVEEAGFKRDDKSTSPTNGRHEEMEIGLEDVDNGMNNQEVLAQQEEILQQIRRDNEAALRTKELVAKLALNGTDDNSE